MEANTPQPAATDGWTYEAGCWRKSASWRGPDALVARSSKEDMFQVFINDRYEAAFHKIDRALNWADSVLQSELDLGIPLLQPEDAALQRLRAAVLRSVRGCWWRAPQYHCAQQCKAWALGRSRN